MKLTILSPGTLSTIQDEGRFGYTEKGFSTCGAVDQYSLKIANILVGNNQNDGAIEMTLTGITARFDCDSVIAITGADMSPEVNGEAIPMYKSVSVQKNDVLTMKSAKSGLRTYLAVAGGFNIAPIMESMSTDLRAGIGGFEGRAFAQNDEIPLRRSIDIFSVGRRRSYAAEDYPEKIDVRVVLEASDNFTQSDIDTFLKGEYTVTENSRIEVCLDGTQLECKCGEKGKKCSTGNIVVSSSGTPKIVMPDGQEDKPIIATVIPTDIPKLAQASEKTVIKFVSVSERRAAWERRKEKMNMDFFEYTTIFNR